MVIVTLSVGIENYRQTESVLDRSFSIDQNLIKSGRYHSGDPDELRQPLERDSQYPRLQINSIATKGTSERQKKEEKSIFFSDETNKDINDFVCCLEYLLKKLPYNVEVKISKNAGVVQFLLEVHFKDRCICNCQF